MFWGLDVEWRCNFVKGAVPDLETLQLGALPAVSLRGAAGGDCADGACF